MHVESVVTKVVGCCSPLLRGGGGTARRASLKSVVVAVAAAAFAHPPKGRVHPKGCAPVGSFFGACPGPCMVAVCQSCLVPKYSLRRRSVPALAGMVPRRRPIGTSSWAWARRRRECVPPRRPRRGRPALPVVELRSQCCRFPAPARCCQVCRRCAGLHAARALLAAASGGCVALLVVGGVVGCPRHQVAAGCGTAACGPAAVCWVRAARSLMSACTSSWNASPRPSNTSCGVTPKRP